MSQLFSTELLPASERIEAWQWKAQQICGDCRVELPRIGPFHGTIDSRTVGGLRLSQFSSSPLSFWKWPVDTTNPEQHACIVITQLRGARRYLQAGAAVLLKPGDSTLIDSAQPWSSHCETDCARLYLRVPRWLMEDRLHIRGLPVAQRIPGNTRLGAALFRITTSLRQEAETEESKSEDAGVMDAYFDLLSACLGQPIPNDGFIAHSSRVFLRIQSFIEQQLTEPGMSPTEIASSVGISLRQLHRLFSMRGHSVGEWIRVRRLEQCRRDLMNTRLRDRTITEIAFFWGFCDSAHFSRLFRKQFGMSPRTFRASACGQSWNEKEPERALIWSSAGLRQSRTN
ncbi:MAG: helix-turn-helix domain-containing protein [Acidobacteriia bacterium]|nr:helix-turn-helix domain-containing protein [Terriglobia bacterium]